MGYRNKFSVPGFRLHLSKDSGLLSQYTDWTVQNSNPPTRGKGFISYHNIQTGSGGPPILLLSGYFGFFPGVRRPGRQASPCLPSSTRVKNEWSYTPLPLYVPWRGKGHLFHNFFGPLTTWNRVLPQNEARWSSFRLETFHVLWYPC